MRKVTRSSEPQILKENKEEWTKILLKKYEEADKKITNVASEYKNQYKCQDVNDQLKIMYGDYCCFCEGEIISTGYEEIEHFRPKSKFPELCFEWENLHQICTKCNKKKNNKWDDKYPIYDPVKDDVNVKLRYKGPEIIYDIGDKRGENTVIHLELNTRPGLINWRSRCFLKAQEYKKSGASEEVKKTLIEALRLTHGQSSFVTYLKNYLEV